MGAAYPLILGPAAGWGWNYSNPGFSAHALDATNDAIGWVFQAPSALTIAQLGCRIDLRAGTPPTYRISLQGVSATTGTPDGTVKGGGSPASTTFTPPADATWNAKWKWFALDNSYACSRGEMLSIVVEYSSGTVNGTNYTSIHYATNNMSVQAMGLPFASTNTAGTWAKQVFSWPLFGYRTSTSRLGNIMQGSSAWTVATTGQREVARFTVPAAWGATFKVVGVRAMISIPPASNTFKLGLWDGTTLLQDVTIDSDMLGGQNGARMCELYFDESSLATLNCGTMYRVGVECIGNSTTGLRVLDFNEYEDSEVWRCQMDVYREQWNGSAWVQNSTQVPEIAVILDDFTEPAAGGGLLLNAGMVGGLRG